MSGERMQLIQRYELKYVIDEETAEGIKRAIRGYFSPDKHIPPKERGYIVNNLYFDTPNFRFYWDVQLRQYRRSKPRIRYYGTSPDDMLWLELKNRIGSVIWKYRRSVPVMRYPDLLWDEETPPSLEGDYDRSFTDVVRFNLAYPVMHVRYFREPYVSDVDDYGRITFDYRLAYHSTPASYELNPPAKDFLFYDDAVTAKNQQAGIILEIKVDTAIPPWAIQIVQDFNLVQRGFSKYCYAIDHATEEVATQRKSSLM